MTEMDESKPASEQLDLTHGMVFDLTAADVYELASKLENAEAADTEDADEVWLGEWVDALKQLESAAEDARKEVFEDELHERVDVDDSVGPLTKRSGKNTWVDDSEGAFAAVSDAGEDPMDVAKVSIGDLRDVLGPKADEFIGSAEYTYFRREA